MTRRLLHDSLRATAKRYPEQLALVTDTDTYTYSDLLDASLKFAGGLQELGLRRGERVAIHLDNGWASAVTIYGTLLAGGVIMCLHLQTKPENLAYILRDSEASVWVTEARLSGWLETVAHSSLRGLVVSGASSAELAAAPLGAEVTTFEALLGQALSLPTAVGTVPLDLAALIYTSGTTGKPKGVMMSHHNMVFTLGSVLEYLGLRPSDRLLSSLSFAFSYGLYQLLMATDVGATLIVGRADYPAHLAQRLQSTGATVFPGVPTAFAGLIALAKQNLRLPEVRCVTNAAAALPVNFVPALESLFPNARIFSMYGLTECKRVCFLAPDLLAKHPDSVGRAMPGTEVFLLSETGRPVAAGEIGILHVRGEHVMMGYWKQPEQSTRMLKAGRYPGEHVLCTHDLFKMDAAGLLYFVSRSDDLIKTRGEKVSPLELEHILYALPGVLEATVIGVPDILLGEAIRAYLVLEPGAELSERDVKHACSKHLEAVKVPQQVFFVDDLPKTPSGKIRRQSLRDVRT